MTKYVSIIACLLVTAAAYAQSPLELLASKNPAELKAKEVASILESDLEATAAQAEGICFTIKIYKDRENHDAKVWKELVAQAIDMMKDIESDVNDWIDDAAVFFQNAYSKRGGDFGVRGEVFIHIDANKNDAVQVQEEVSRESVVENPAEEATITCDCEKEEATDDEAVIVDDAE